MHQAFILSSMFSSSSASSPDFTRSSIDTGCDAALPGSKGGLGEHTRDTLFFPCRLVGIDGVSIMFSRMLPVQSQ